MLFLCINADYDNNMFIYTILQSCKWYIGTICIGIHAANRRLMFHRRRTDAILAKWSMPLTAQHVICSGG